MVTVDPEPPGRVTLPDMPSILFRAPKTLWFRLDKRLLSALETSVKHIFCYKCIFLARRMRRALEVTSFVKRSLMVNEAAPNRLPEKV
jgi:hypothetical protein